MTLKDADNFAVLMQRYEMRLLAYIHRLIKISAEGAEDILQEVFIKIYKNLNAFDQDLKFSSWVYRITYNHTISHYRKYKKTLETLSLEDNEMLFANLKSELDLKKEVENELLREKIGKCLAKLDRKYRDILILKYLEDKDYKEIANILKKPMGTVATLLNRAKKALKQTLIDNKITL